METAADTPSTDRRARWVAWSLMWVAYATYYLGRKGFSVTKTTVQADFGLSDLDLAAIDTSFLAAYALGQFAFGFLGDRFGARRILSVGMLASALACALFGLSASTVGFVSVFAVNGLAQASGWPGTTRAMAEWTTRKNRGTVMAWWSTCYQVGGVAAGALAAGLLALWGWRSAFWVPALVLALVGLAVGRWLRRGPEARREPRLHDASARFDESRAARRALLRRPALWAYGVSYFFIKLIRYSLMLWLPFYLAKVLSYEAAEAGLLAQAFELGGIGGAIGAGMLSDRLRGQPRAMVSLVSLLGLAGALWLYTRLDLTGWAANVAGLALIGALLFGPDTLLSGAAAQDLGGAEAAATATGFVNGLGSLGAVLQGFITVALSQAFGWEALFLVFVGLSVLAAAVLFAAQLAGHLHPRRVDGC